MKLFQNKEFKNKTIIKFDFVYKFYLDILLEIKKMTSDVGK